MSVSRQPSSSPSEDVIVPIDPGQALAPKPLIGDILRTRYCIPGSVFLVEGVDASVTTGRRHRAVRLLLGDGELCIQALLSSDMHGFVDDGQIRAGCYVRVDRFEVRWIDLWGGVEDLEDDGTGNFMAAQRRRPPRGRMVYLLVDDLATVGWNSAYLAMLESASRHETATKDKVAVARWGESATTDPGIIHHTRGPERRAPAPPAGEIKIAPEPEAEMEDMPVDTRQTSKHPNQIAGLKSATAGRAEDGQTGRSDERAKALANTAGRVRSEGGSLPWNSDDPTKPLKLTELRAIPRLPYRQNWMVNVLAVVASLSEVEPCHLPPYHQRTARLADPSTGKQVLLTVFLDPDDFDPRVGSVVLLLGVKNHMSDGGSLRKYVSDRPRNGRRWWHEEPCELGWCDAVGLREWWDSRRLGGL